MNLQFQAFHNTASAQLPAWKRARRSVCAMVLLTLLCIVMVPAGLWAAESKGSDTVRVMTFNIRMNTPADGKDAWPRRKEMVVSVIRDFQPDFLGVQEAKPEQVAFLRSALSDYGVLTRSREKDPSQGEACSVFYRKDRWEIDPKEQGTYWLSDTPEEPASITWGNACTRIVTWAKFREAGTKRPFYFINTHFDHRSAGARRKSAVFLRGRIGKLPSEVPVVLVGDFNASETDESIRVLKGDTDGGSFVLSDTFRVAHPHTEKAGTFNGFAGRETGPKIDYIFTRGNVTVLDAAIVRTNRDGRYPSDHFPVTATLRLPAE